MAGTFRGMSVEDGAAATMARLDLDDVVYAGDPVRGEFRGFAALHDRMDANMIVPFAGEDDTLPCEDGSNADAWVEWANLVMDRASELIVESWANSRQGCPPGA